ncbi:MAG: reverse transcriptase family protein [Candidatus Thiodiazotropha taylori]|nr:reverse transcriptase family protein [Candidatus Thiodiazotropha taylori]
MFTSVLNNRLTKFLDASGGLNENQAGFRKGYSTTDHIFSLNALFELCRSRNQKFYCAFIDFSRAFDSVWRIGLWKKLLENDINGKFFQIVHNMYNGIKSSVSVNGQDSPFFTCNCGVRQGENLSPVLFAIYLNDLETCLLHKNLSGITIDVSDGDVDLYLKLFTLLYADDTVLMANDPLDLQNCLDAFAEYCQKWKLTINIEKTKIVIFGTRRKSRLNFKIGEDTIEITNSYKYLGVLFSQSGSFLGARKHVVQQAKKQCSSYLQG